MRRSIASALVWIALAGVASAQTYGPATDSVIRPTGYGWRNHVGVPDGPCGCDIPVRTDCYDHCCPCCGLRPLCLLKRVGRMLDCLLPCNKCCDGGCLFGGCLLGGRGCCGGCGPIGCTTPAYGTPMPTLGDPFLDDPISTPPIPTPSPATEVRYAPSRTSHAAGYRASPWKVSNGPATMTAPASSDRHAHSGRPSRITIGKASPITQTHEQSVLRRTSAEEPIAPARLPEIETARPIVRSQSPAADDADYDAIPHNPLR
jgi:hypothetical protein